MLVLLPALVSALLTRLQIVLHLRLRLIAEPRADRWHTAPTPSSGGLAIFLSCAIFYWLVCPGVHPWIALATAGLWIVGFLDDRLRLPPERKLVAQVIAAAFAVASGAVLPATPWFLLNVGLSFFWIVMITNAFNLIDNMDGLCAGVAIIICLFRCWLLAAEGYHADAKLLAILAGAFAGFLLSNYHPARIFMGDCGSMPVGFALGALMLAGPAPHHQGVQAIGFLSPALTFAYPIFDVALVCLLRIRAGRPVWEGGRDHSSHRLASLGWDQRQVVWMLWLLTAFGCSLGLMVHWIPRSLFAAAALLLTVLGGFGLILARVPVYSLPRTEESAYMAVDL